MMLEVVHVDVVFALPEEQRVFTAEVKPGATVQDAIEASGVLGWYPQIDLSAQKVGIYSKLVSLTQVVGEDDRIEIYRPVTADPKTVRRKSMADGGNSVKATQAGASASH